MLLTKFKRLAIASVLIAGTALPHIAVAQSEDGSDPGAGDAVVIDDAAPVGEEDMVPVAEEAPVPEPATGRPVQAPPEWRVNAIYLGKLQTVRSGWFQLEYGVEDLVRQQRLGTFNPVIGQRAAGRYPATVDSLERNLTLLSSPPQFAHVQQLHVESAAEFRAAMAAAEWWLSSGDQGGLQDSQTHFARFDRLIGQALLELG